MKGYINIFQVSSQPEKCVVNLYFKALKKSFFNFVVCFFTLFRFLLEILEF